MPRPHSNQYPRKKPREETLEDKRQRYCEQRAYEAVIDDLKFLLAEDKHRLLRTLGQTDIRRIATNAGIAFCAARFEFEVDDAMGAESIESLFL